MFLLVSKDVPDMTRNIFQQMTYDDCREDERLSCCDIDPKDANDMNGGYSDVHCTVIQ